MKKETLIRLIDEEFGDALPFSWLIDTVIKSIVSNDSKIKICSAEYEEQAKDVIHTLNDLHNRLVEWDKKTDKSISIPRQRETNLKIFLNALKGKTSGKVTAVKKGLSK